MHVHVMYDEWINTYMIILTHALLDLAYVTI